MRTLQIQFHPEQIRISAEEILADLHYPARRDPQRDPRKRARRPRDQR